MRWRQVSTICRQASLGVHTGSARDGHTKACMRGRACLCAGAFCGAGIDGGARAARGPGVLRPRSAEGPSAGPGAGPRRPGGGPFGRAGFVTRRRPATLVLGFGRATGACGPAAEGPHWQSQPECPRHGDPGPMQGRCQWPLSGNRAPAARQSEAHMAQPGSAPFPVVA